MRILGRYKDSLVTIIIYIYIYIYMHSVGIHVVYPYSSIDTTTGLKKKSFYFIG